MIAVLGLTDDESRAYRELLGRPSCTSQELAAALDLADREAARLLGRLEQLGLAARSGESSARFAASPPELALGAVLVQRQNELKLAELELASLSEVYRSGVTRRSSADVIDVVHGADAIRQRVEQLQLGARREVLWCPAIRTAEDAAEVAAVARGVSYRVVLERALLDEDPSMARELERATSAGQELRIADSVPLKLLIADRELALLPIAGSNGAAAVGALLVRPSALLDALVALFDMVWRRAAPITMTAESPVDEFAVGAVDDVDARILGLLAAGLTDQAVAVRLGLSLRTVQRRVHYLMELAGARTRLQLGLQLGRRMLPFDAS